MRFKRIASKIQGSIFLLGVFALSLLKAPTAFADFPRPDGGPHFSRCHADWNDIICYPEHIWDKYFFYGIVFFLVGTLIIELPIFLLLGFKTKKKLGLAILANVISVSVYHTISALLIGTNVLIAELLITAFECVFLVTFLRKEMSVKKIIAATIVANVVSFLLGAALISFI